MAEKKKRPGGSHAKPVEEKKRSLFSRGAKSSEPEKEKDIETLAEELFEPAFIPDSDAVPAEPDIPAPQISELPEETDGEAEEPVKLSREEKRQAKEAEREARKAAKEAEKADESPEKQEKRRVRKIAIIVASVIAALVFAAATYGGYAVTESDRTLPNVYLGEVFAGSMTEDGVRAALEENNWDKIAGAKLTVKLPAKISFSLTRDESGAVLTADEAVAAAMRFGHDGTWYENLFRYVYNFFSAQDLVEYYRMLNADYIRGAVDAGVAEFAAATAESGYVIEEEKSMMYMIKGGGELDFDKDALTALVGEALVAGRSELEYASFVKEPAMPDFNAIHKELERDPVDAYFTDTFEVVEDVVGCKFDVAEAEKIWKEAAYGDALEIPMDITFPEVTGEALSAMLFRDILGEQTTYYPNSSDNRINNLNQAVKKISGTVLLPGETFSYNETVGQRTEEAGFLPAGAYDDGEVVEQIGGGVCQVSSTIYSATLYAQMETVDRTCHFFAVDYLDKGMDATVSWPKPDFKFKNCRDYPIKIIVYCDNEARSITAAIMGTDVDGSYVKIRRDTYTKFGEYGEAIGITIFQYRDIYAADGTYLRTESYDYMDDYYLHGYKEITEKAKAASEAAAAAAAGAAAEGTGDDGGAAAEPDYSGTYN